MYYETSDLSGVVVFSLSRPYSKVISLASDSEWEAIVSVFSSDALGFPVKITDKVITLHPGWGIIRADGKDIESISGYCSDNICVYAGADSNEEILNIARGLYSEVLECAV